MKPFTQKVEENVSHEEKIAPFIDLPQGGRLLEYVEETADLKEDFQNKNASKGKIFGSLISVLFLAMLVFFLALIVDAVDMLGRLSMTGGWLYWLYLAALSLLFISLALVLWRSFKQMKALENAQKLQQFFEKQKKDPDAELIVETLKLLDFYETFQNPHLIRQSRHLRESMSHSHDYKMIYHDLDEQVLEVIDAEVKKRISAASSQAALSTAISPLALLDALIVIWRSVRLSTEIAGLYGLKPGWLGTMVLLKKGAFNVFFAGTAELLSEYISEAAEATMISRLSTAATQGVSNGVLLARLGYGVMQACRPLPMRIKRERFTKSVVISIRDLFGSQQNKD